MATQWAKTPMEWAAMFAENQSGTYNNQVRRTRNTLPSLESHTFDLLGQWVVLSTAVNSTVLPTTDLLYVLEQIPGE